MVEEDLTKLRETYRIPEDIELILHGPNERACFPMRGCTALHLNAFVSGMHLPLHLMFRRILRAYDLAPTQVSPNGWSQMVGSMYLWFSHTFGAEMSLHVFQTIYQSRKLPRKKGGEEEVGWYYFCPWGSHKPLVTGCPSSIKQWKESWFWVSGNWQRVFDDPESELDALSVSPSSLRTAWRRGRRPEVDIPGGLEDPELRIHLESTSLFSRAWVDGLQRKVVEGLSRAGNKEVPGASKVIEVDDAPEVEVPLSRKRKAKASGTGAGAGASAVEIADPYTADSVPPLQSTLAVNTSGEVVLEGPSKSTPTPEGGTGGPYDSKRRLRELIRGPGVRIPDDSLRNVLFYPSMGAQAVKKYFTPKWKEFSSHGELEDVLEASLASAIRASAIQMKVLSEFRTRMQEQRRLVAQAS
ncbi:Uncharacterized protein Adt_46577 [Abeliophyllum distichum]|uniref:Transposase (putative) gypsy type domain-containing protein n=1 Tax=Abeliophyllum distichum TaxID=126358 RepID=A0ABD1NZ89_9LAMI